MDLATVFTAKLAATFLSGYRPATGSSTLGQWLLWVLLLGVAGWTG